MTRKLFTRSFWADTAERACKSAAQTPLLGLALSDVGPVDAFGIDWKLAGGFAIGGAVLSVLTSVASAPIGQTDSASLLPPR
jgi:hypothetical protein